MTIDWLGDLLVETREDMLFCRFLTNT